MCVYHPFTRYNISNLERISTLRQKLQNMYTFSWTPPYMQDNIHALFCIVGGIEPSVDISSIEGQLIQIKPDSAILAIVKGVHEVHQGQYKAAVSSLTQGEMEACELKITTYFVILFKTLILVDLYSAARVLVYP